MLVIAAIAALRFVLRHLLEVKFQPVEVTDGVEPIPRLAEGKADLPVVRDRALEVIDPELWSKGRETRRG